MKNTSIRAALLLALAGTAAPGMVIAEGAAATLAATPASGATAEQASGSEEGAQKRLPPVQIIGDIDAARRLPGSGAVVSSEQLDQEGTTDIHQVLKTVPGVYVREEEGEGLRPNIGIRGATAERSANITLMEDGVLIAPAPYSNPAAYYFPTMMRIDGVEILKGAPLLRYGPQTTGGVINLLSTPFREDTGGTIETVIDERGSTDAHINYGGSKDRWDWLLQTVQRNNDGFQDIDRSDRNTGFDIEDYVAKLRWRGDRQHLTLKLQYSEEVSNATYLGLTDEDFRRNPNRRYGLSEIDQMRTRHSGASLTQDFFWSDRVTSTTTIYRNDFSRNWFKLRGGALIDAADAGDADALGILRGTVDSAGTAFANLTYRNNNRDYVSEGVQTNFSIDLNAHQLSAGLRYHEDEMDRFQPDEIFEQVNGSLVFQSSVAPTGGNNRFEDAEAISLWLLDSWQVSNQLAVNLALRYEDVETSRTQYADAARTTVQSTRSNSSDELLPGASFTYDFGDSWQVLGGYHRGFSPLGGGASANEDPETSDNFEFGGRFRHGPLFVETIGFFSDFSDKVENCSVGAPCSNGNTSGTFTTGEAEIKGVELQVGTAVDWQQLRFPLDLTYTYTDAEISKDNAVSGLNKGDQLKEVPENTFSLRAGVETQFGWHNYAVVKYIDENCSVAGCNNTATELDETESLVVVDFISRYALSPETEVHLRVENLFDEQKIVSRLPDGARPNKPQTLSVGFRHQF